MCVCRQSSDLSAWASVSALSDSSSPGGWAFHPRMHCRWALQPRAVPHCYRLLLVCQSGHWEATTRHLSTVRNLFVRYLAHLCVGNLTVIPFKNFLFYCLFFLFTPLIPCPPFQSSDLTGFAVTEAFHVNHIILHQLLSLLPRWICLKGKTQSKSE